MVNIKPIRRSQLITPFGVGSILDFRGPESLMTAGLDSWPYAFEDKTKCEELIVVEERLQARLKVDHFRLPVQYSENAAAHLGSIPFVRFPSWQYCPTCGTMKDLGINGAKARCSSDACSSLSLYKRAWLIPVRIIAVCKFGHITDFPYLVWVHKGPVRDPAQHILTWRAKGASGALSGIVLSCTCGASKSLEGAFNFHIEKGGALHSLAVDCPGARPWFLDTGSPNSCGEFLRVVQRGASNVYFSAVKSSIYLPTSEFDESDVFQRVVDSVTAKLRSKPESEWSNYISVQADMTNLSVETLQKAIMKRLKPSSDSSNSGYLSEEEFRLEEFNVLTSENLRPGKELVLAEHSIGEYANLDKYFSRIRLVKKLRETRVLHGFSRLSPSDETDTAFIQKLSLSEKVDWLPAIVVRGEGIFFQFRNEEIERWLTANERFVARRGDKLKQVFSDSLKRPLPILKKAQARFVLMHTFAHSVIRELVYECGYGTSSLRERVYCGLEDGVTDTMNGVLIYTASGDAEGTMGGLVRQGKPDRLVATLKGAMEEASWCAVDPICFESKGQGTNSANLAACHSCILLPETSCEEGNRLLDRVMLVGRPDNRTLGYFGDLVFH